MLINIVQVSPGATTTSGTGTFTLSDTFSSPVTAGNAILALIAEDNQGLLSSITLNSISDSQTDPYSIAYQNWQPGISGPGSVAALATDVAGGTCTVSVSLSPTFFSGNARFSILLIELSGVGAEGIFSSDFHSIDGAEGNNPVVRSIDDAIGNSVAISYNGSAGSGGPGVLSGLNAFSIATVNFSFLCVWIIDQNGTDLPTTALGYVFTLAENVTAGASFHVFTAGLSFATAAQRGNIDYDQIKRRARHGSGKKIQMFTGSEPGTGNVPEFDSDHNLIDGGTALGDLATKAGVQNSYLYAVDTGTANVYVASQTPAPTLVAGSMIMLKIAHTNTGASTLAMNGGAAKAIKKRAAVALTGGELLAGQIILMVYDGTNWQLVGGVTWATIAAIQQQTHTYADDTGSTNTYVVTLSPAPIAIVEGSVVAFKAANANSGASTLNVNSNGAAAIEKNGSSALGSGDIHSGQIILVMFDGTNWQIVGGGGGSLTLETNGTANGSQTLLNQVAGSNMTITDDGSGDVTFACSFSASSAFNLNLGIAALGQPPGGSSSLGKYVFTEATNFAANFSGSRGNVDVNPTATQTWTITKNGSSVGTISISTGGAVTYSGSSVSFAVGDVLRVIGSSAADATLSGVDIVIAGTLAAQPSNPLIIIPFTWMGQPGASQEVGKYVFANACTFAANWSGARGDVDANPTSTWTANVNKNGVLVGTIQVSTGGVFTFATSGGVAVSFVAGDVLTVITPSSIDTTLQGFSATFETSTGGYAQVGGDIGNTAASPKVTGLQGVGISSTAPTDGRVLEYISASGLWTPGGGALYYGADSGSADTYAVTISPLPALAAGMTIAVKIANANTGASTLTVNGGSAKSIKKTASTALASGDLVAGQIAVFTYDGTNWQLVSWPGSSGGGGTAAPTAISTQPDWPPGSAGSLDDEFTGTVLNGVWSWVNQGSVVATLANNSWLNLNLASSTAGDNVAAIVQTAPATPWEVTAKCTYNSPSGNWLGGGIVLRESSSGKLIMWGVALYNSRGFDVSQWNSTTSNNSDTTGGLNWQGMAYLKVKDDGTNLIFSLSFDGASFVKYNSRGRTAFMSGGPNEVGLGYNCQVVSATGTPIAMGCDWFRRTL